MLHRDQARLINVRCAGFQSFSKRCLASISIQHSFLPTKLDSSKYQRISIPFCPLQRAASHRKDNRMALTLLQGGFMGLHIIL